MIERELKVGRWHIDFLFAEDDYDDELVLTRLYDIDAPIYIMQEVNRKMDRGNLNAGFTYANPDLMEIVLVVGPSSTGAEFQNTFAHEVYHAASIIADSIGVDLAGEAPAYMVGDMTLELIDVICQLGCTHCNKF